MSKKLMPGMVQPEQFLLLKLILKALIRNSSSQNNKEITKINKIIGFLKVAT